MSGAAFLLSSWDELTCRPAGATFDDMAGIGGAVSLVALGVEIAGMWPKRALLVAGVAIGFTLLRSTRRVWLTAPIAATAWVAGTGWLLYDTMITAPR